MRDEQLTWVWLQGHLQGCPPARLDQAEPDRAAQRAGMSAKEGVSTLLLFCRFSPRLRRTQRTVEGSGQPSWREPFLRLSTERLCRSSRGVGAAVPRAGESKSSVCYRRGRAGHGGKSQGYSVASVHGSLSVPRKLLGSDHRADTAPSAAYTKQRGRMRGRLETPKERSCPDLLMRTTKPREWSLLVPNVSDQSQVYRYWHHTEQRWLNTDKGRLTPS